MKKAVLYLFIGFMTVGFCALSFADQAIETPLSNLGIMDSDIIKPPLGTEDQQPATQAAPSADLSSSKPIVKGVASKIEIVYSAQSLGSVLLSQYYTAYKIIIQNNGPNDLRILDGEIVNGCNGQDAYQSVMNSVHQTSTHRFKPLSLLLKPVLPASTRARDLSRLQSLTARVHNQIPRGEISAHNQVSAYTFVPVGNKPEVKLTYRDEGTDEIIHISQ